jgi:threonine dehydrogenase-like Zn-dependent dehydrogenase
MRATVMFGAGDVRTETVPDARLIEPTDALVAVSRAAICGSDLWCTRRASTEGSSAQMTPTEHRPKQFVSRRQTEHSSSCRPAKTTR